MFCLSHFQMKRCLSRFVFFFNLFLQYHIQMKIFNNLSTNLHPIFFQLNLNSMQLNLNPIVELNSIKFKFQWNLDLLTQIQFKLHCNVVHDSISYRNEFVSLISKTFGNFSCSIKIFVFFLFFHCF